LIWIAVLGLGLSIFWTGRLSAQQATPSDDQVNAIARQLFCPVCQNTPLDVCPTQACQQWRDLIRQMLAEGQSADAIKQYFVVHYGARVLSEPPRAGFNWLIYVVPPAAFLLGAYLLFRAYQAWKRTPAESAPGAEAGSPPGVEDRYIERVEEELRRRQ
jgi:cytochrome c-type biogenesis protein CcmH